MGARRVWKGWELREAGPADARHTALLLPGGLCTAAFYDDVLADPRLVDRGVRFVAATPPGFGGRPAPGDVSVEGFARLAGELAASLGCDLVAGHSYFGNVAIEMAAAGEFSGSLVLLSPSFSREHEFKALGVLDRVGRVPGLGRLAWAMVPRVSARAMKGNFPPARRDEFVAEIKRNDPVVCRRMVRRYFEHLDRYGSLVQRLCDTGVKAWVIFGERDQVGLTDDERSALEACPSVTMVTVPDATHVVMLDQPARVAELILDVMRDHSDA